MSYKRFLERFQRYVKQASTEDRSKIANMLVQNNGILIPQPDNSFFFVPKEEVVYIESPKKGIVFIQSISEKIEYTNYTCNILEYALNNFEGFMSFSHSLVVNKEKIKNYNSYYRKVVFVNDIEVVVTKAVIDNVCVKLLGRSKDLKEDTYFGASNYMY